MRIGYARTSTAQEEQAKSIEGQVADLEAAGCDRVITEQRSAFRSKRRPGWDELWALVGSGRVTTVLVVDQSRLSRSGDDRTFLDLCGVKGTRVMTLLGGEIETQSDSGFLTASMMSVLNEMQSRITAAKVRDGLRRRRSAGYYACGKVPFGYAYDGQKVVPHPENWTLARAMWDGLAATGFNVSGWLKHGPGDWTPRGVKAWMANPILRGIVRNEPGGTTALISYQEWNAAQLQLQARSVMRGQTAHCTHLFTGLVRCDACNRNLHNVLKNARHPRLVCKWRCCKRYGSGLRVSEVRDQVVQALATHHRALATEAAADDACESPEVIKVREAIAHLERAGVPGVDALIEQQKAQLVLLQQQPSGPRVELLDELFADPATLALATDQELRAVVIEFVASIDWLGGWESLKITLR